MFVPGIVLTEQYQLMERCGAGGQGDVWIVKDIRTGMLRAAKISKIPYSERSETQFAQMRTAYQKETETLKALGNRHVVTIFDFFTDKVSLSEGVDGQKEYLCQCVVMEQAEQGDMGKPSNSALFRDLPIRDRILFLQGVARGLHAAHAAGITHCDVKPSNLLLYKEQGEIYAKLCDFGAAQSAIRGTTALGTAQYMAPELDIGHSATLMSDVFSLGVTFHELLTGDLPNAKDPYDERRRDERTFFKAKYSTIDYSLEPIGGEDNEPLRQMLKEMLLLNPSDRPTIGDIVQRLGKAYDTVTRYSMTEERPVSRVEMDTYIWHPGVHRRLGERMYFFYLNNLTLDSWQRLQKKLNEKEIFSFSIHRVNGETDFILRGWFSDQGISHVRTILTDFGEGVVKDSESKGFMAVDVLPTPPPNALWVKKEYSDFKEWLKISVESWTGQDQYSRLRKLGIVVGKIEESDTHIRVFLRIEVTKAGEQQHAITYSDNFEKFFREQSRERRISSTYFVWRISNNTTFIVEFRLTAFKEFKNVISDFAKMTNEKNLNRAGPSKFHTTSLLELDARGIVESDDGEITALLRALATARR